MGVRRRLITSEIAQDVQSISRRLNSDALKESKILVTGGAGFLGSWTCDVLTSIGASVDCADNLSTGIKKNIDHLHGLENFDYKGGDITAPHSLKADYNFILHLASHASPEEYQKRPVETLLANSTGTLNMLELARLSDSTLFYASSSEVYGDSTIIPTPETFWGNVNPIGPRSCYDEGKRFGEALCMAYKRSYGIDVRIARIFNSYGPRLREDGAYGRVVSRFIKQALTEEDITIYGDGRQTRSFCYVKDTVRGILTMLTKKEADGEVFNIGNPDELTVLSLARKVKKLTGSNSKLVMKPLPPDDPKRRCPDISKIRDLLGWAPEVDLDDGMRSTILWFKAKLRG